jgi:hypothetical protein
VINESGDVQKNALQLALERYNGDDSVEVTHSAWEDPENGPIQKCSAELSIHSSKSHWEIYNSIATVLGKHIEYTGNGAKEDKWNKLTDQDLTVKLANGGLWIMWRDYLVLRLPHKGVPRWWGASKDTIALADTAGCVYLYTIDVAYDGRCNTDRSECIVYAAERRELSLPAAAGGLKIMGYGRMATHRPGGVLPSGHSPSAYLATVLYLNGSWHDVTESRGGEGEKKTANKGECAEYLIHVHNTQSKSILDSGIESLEPRETEKSSVKLNKDKAFNRGNSPSAKPAGASRLRASNLRHRRREMAAKDRGCGFRWSRRVVGAHVNQ